MATSRWNCGYQNLRGGIDPVDITFLPRVIGFVDIRKYLQSRDETLSPPGAAGPRRCPERQPSPRTGNKIRSQSGIRQWVRSFHTARGGMHIDDLCFPPPYGVVDICEYL